MMRQKCDENLYIYTRVYGHIVEKVQERCRDDDDNDDDDDDILSACFFVRWMEVYV